MRQQWNIIWINLQFSLWCNREFCCALNCTCFAIFLWRLKFYSSKKWQYEKKKQINKLPIFFKKQAKQEYSNLHNVESEHQNKPLAFELKIIAFFQHCKRLKELIFSFKIKASNISWPWITLNAIFTQ